MIVAIDPGDVHVGMALFDDDATCQRAWEATPAESVAWLREHLRACVIDEVVVEDFQLYASQAQTQIGSRFETCRLIGALDYVTCWHGGGRIGFVLQGAAIKVPTRKILAARGVKLRAHTNRAGGHAADAELHGHYRLMRKAGTQ